jgi:hypothetical protein
MGQDFIYEHFDIDMTNFIKIIMAGLLLLCLADMPYGYYQLVRFLAMAAFAFLSYESYERGQKGQILMYICLALLFQPFLKVHLGRTLWNLVDVLVAAYLLLSLQNQQQINKQKL